ncbi:MAG TPA: ABC transporter permease/substrate-binding protein [Kofleriaceae bacterium]|nr:ABC transporter permease/substrate-binding protein [Kofleriaceae bacterium]
MTELLRGLPPLLASHFAIALVALATGIAISLPLALAIARRPRAAAGVLAVAGVIQTVPGLALLALMVPVLANTGGLGIGIPAFGFGPAVIALTLYAILPIARNAITGLHGVDATIVEAARGLGMTDRQILLRVELPLAAPVIAAGIRTAAVWTVGAATLATPVGQPCLGNYIFAGLQTRNWSMLLVGVAAAAALSVALDALLGAAERALAGRDRRRALYPAAALAALAVLVLGVLPQLATGDGDGSRSGGGVPAALRAGQRPAVTRVKLGAKTFTEQYVLVEVLRARLAAAGIAVEVASSLGSTVIFEALRDGEIDAYVDYSGTVWTNYMRREAGLPRWQILAEVEAWLAREHGMRSLGSLGFENAYALAIRRDTGAQLGLRTLDDLARHARTLAMGADYEFFSRREWAQVRGAYGLAFSRTASYDPTLLYDALTHRDVDVISAFSSDGRIAAYDLVVLEDPASALPPYDAMIMLGKKIADDARVSCALAPLRGALTAPLIRQANLMVDRERDKATPAAAAAWLLTEARIARPDCSGTLPP